MSLKKLYDLFDRACDLDPEAQEDFVERECGDDASLAEQLRSLLRAERGVSDTFLDHGAEVTLSPSSPAQPIRPPEYVGPYRIVREVGRGGMGVVYEAEQVRPRRRVAVKVLRKTAVSDEMLRRFDREARVLGRLSHPGIAHIYDGGSAAVRDEVWPYFVMEYIEGQPLDAYIRRSGIDRSARLRLFADICDAVEHAHYHRIVHRDLKPANILVMEGPPTKSGMVEDPDTIGRTPQPKILDFGVARVAAGSLASGTGWTESGQVLGTIGYMSPEQLSGGTQTIDARSDVYALGVLLYRLLSGRMPHDLHGKPVPEVIRLIHDEEPRRIGTVDATLKGDIDTIVTKALEKDPDRRYPSAAALAGDVRRHLSDQPVAARPPSTWYLAGKFGRRHKGLVGGLAAMFLVLVLGLGVSTSALMKAQREHETTEAVTGFLTGTLEAAVPEHRGQIVTMNDVLDRAAGQVGLRFKGEPLIEAKLRTTIGKTYAALGEYGKARAQLQVAVERWTETQGPGDLDTLDVLAELAVASYHHGLQLEEARRYLGEAQERYRRVLSRDHPKRLRLLIYLASVAVQQGQIGEARRLTREFSALHSSPPDVEDGVVVRLGALADVLVGQGRFAEAEKILLELHSTSPERRSWITERLASLYTAWERPDAAAHWHGAGKEAGDRPE